MRLSWTALQKRSLLVASSFFTLTGISTQGCGDGADVVDIETSAKDGGRCDPKISPLEDPCVVTDALGVFVSPNAPAGGDGTQKAPFNDLRAAFANAVSSSKPNVFLCGTHKAEGVEVPDGVHVFGAFECSASKWVLSQSVRAKIESLGAGKPILLVKGSTKGVRVEAVDFVARADKSSASAIGIVAIDSPALEIVNTTIRAEKGADGVDGVAAMQLANDDEAKINGLANEFGVRGCEGGTFELLCSQYKGGVLGGTNLCKGAGFSGGSGGLGGNGGVYNGLMPLIVGGNEIGKLLVTMEPPSKSVPEAASATTNVSGVAGTPGAPGPDGQSSEGGQFRATGEFAAGDGTPGLDGKAGQGGGGGDGMTPPKEEFASRPYRNGMPAAYANSGGGGGGAGGCPGLAGTHGTGGGASVGLVSIQSTVSLKNVQITTSSGGNGGKGTVGSKGTPGGLGGKGNFSQAGGNGGKGGDGGFGGSGAGGPSIGIAYRGAAPTRDASTKVTVGAGGKGVSDVVGVAASKNGASLESISF